MVDAGVQATARVDRDGRLVAADPPLADLQRAAGSSVGKPVAIPQLAALARSAQSLMVALTRPVLAADEAHDFDLWVRADPDAEGVTLTLEELVARPLAPARLDRAGRLDLSAEQRNDAVPAASMEWAVDSSLAVTHLSDALAALVDADDWHGVPLTRLFRLVEADDGALPLLAALASREDFAGQSVEARKGGSTLVLTGHAIESADGRFGGFRGVAAAGGDERIADEAATMLDEAIDSAMRSPLDLIIDAADRIVERSDGPLRSDYAGYAGDIAAAGRHLLEVIRSMNSDADGDVEAVDFGAAVSEAVALVRPIADRRHVGIETDHPEKRIQVRGERRGIVQIVANILGNAVRHSPDGGTVAVVFDDDGKRGLLTIADQGPGISSLDQARIFERYEQTGAPELAAQGTGLGLAISRRLARAMGGDISLVSAPGEGARFTLTLDRA